MDNGLSHVPMHLTLGSHSQPYDLVRRVPGLRLHACYHPFCNTSAPELGENNPWRLGGKKKAPTWVKAESLFPHVLSALSCRGSRTSTQEQVLSRQRLLRMGQTPTRPVQPGASCLTPPSTHDAKACQPRLSGFSILIFKIKLWPQSQSGQAFYKMESLIRIWIWNT